MINDLDIVDQLHRWADHLEARTEVPVVTTAPTGAGHPQPSRRTALVVLAAAAALVVMLVFVARGRHTGPTPTVDTTAPATTSPFTSGTQLPLMSTRWTTQRDAPTKVVFEIQGGRDGRGQLVGVIGNDRFCSALDAAVTIDGQHLHFDGLSLDTDCPGADAVLASLGAVTTWGYGTLDDELFLRNARGETMLRARGCGDLSCGVDTRLGAGRDPDGANRSLEGADWWLDFRDSGLISATSYAQPLSVGASIKFADGRIEAWAGVAGGCMLATADYSVKIDTVKIGDFERTTDDCGPSVTRLLDRLVGSHRFFITGNVLTLADMQFVASSTVP